MKFYTIKTPSIVQRIFSSYTWRFSSTQKEIYLTFDDDPTPEITDFVLEQLEQRKSYVFLYWEKCIREYY